MSLSDEEKDASSTCPVCMSCIFHPMKTLCNHFLCRACFLQWCFTRTLAEFNNSTIPSGMVKCPAGCATTVPCFIAKVDLAKEKEIKSIVGEDFYSQRRFDYDIDSAIYMYDQGENSDMYLNAINKMFHKMRLHHLRIHIKSYVPYMSFFIVAALAILTTFNYM
jgi:hypothetical protein